MRVKSSKSKNAESLYIIKDVSINGKRTTKIVQSLGTIDQITQLANGEDPYIWAKKRAKELTLLDKDDNKDILITLSNYKKLKYNEHSLYNVGYLYIQSIYHQLKLNSLAKSISNNYKFDYNLNSVLSSLIYSRIIYPCSKLSTFIACKSFLEKQDYDLHHIYRALDVLADNSDSIQEHLYKHSCDIIDRNSNVLYYDCTNFFFEIEEANGLKQYGKSKENRPNPIIQMGLFLDGNGIPLAFNITPGNTNEQTTLKPLESRIIKDFNLSKLVVCTDGGLSSNSNKKFNSIANRAYITVQSLKKLKNHLKEWAFETSGWKVNGLSGEVDISDITLIDNPNTYYKERWINENGLEERLVITFSPKYALYQKNVRIKQIDRAISNISSGKLRKTKNQNDPARFIKEQNVTQDGEIASTTLLDIDNDKIASEAMYDGYYGIVTNLEDDIRDIIKINHNRWEIEETFKIMKSEFEARPVYLQKDNRIEAHFLTCFISMVIFRILEKQLDKKYSAENIIDTLRDMNVLRLNGHGYIPTYQINEITKKLEDIYSFELDTQIIDNDKIKKIQKDSKKKKVRIKSE